MSQLALLMGLLQVGSALIGLPPVWPGCGEYTPMNGSMDLRWFVDFPQTSVAGKPTVRAFLATDYAGFDPVVVKAATGAGFQTTRFTVRAPSTIQYIASVDSALLTLDGNHNFLASIRILYKTPGDRSMGFGYFGIPRTALDTEYYAIADTPLYQSEVSIVEIAATEFGQTLVTVNGRSLVLNRWEVWRWDNQADLTGLWIKADNRIAVFTGVVTASGISNPDMDSSFTQLPPVKAWGTFFIAVYPDPEMQSVLQLKILAIADKTSVNMNGQQLQLTSVGQSITFKPSGGAFFISSNKPIEVAQSVYNTRLGYRSFEIVPSQNMWLSSYSYDTDPNFNHQLLIAVLTPLRNYVIMNGRSLAMLPVQWNVLSTPQGEYSYVVLSVNPGIVQLSGQLSYVTFYCAIHSMALSSLTPAGVSYLSVLGMFYCKTSCLPCAGTQCDWRDDDCDGSINDEICGNNQDDDGDGLVDEDCCGVVGSPLKQKPPIMINGFPIWQPGDLSQGAGGAKLGCQAGAGMIPTNEGFGGGLITGGSSGGGSGGGFQLGNVERAAIVAGSIFGLSLLTFLIMMFIP